MPQDASEAPLNRRDRRRLEIYERIVEAGEALFEEQREEFTTQLQAQRQQEAVQNWFAHIYETAQIEDNRHRFFTF